MSCVFTEDRREKKGGEEKRREHYSVVIKSVFAFLETEERKIKTEVRKEYKMEDRNRIEKSNQPRRDKKKGKGRE